MALIHLDYQGLIRLHWSPLILDELSRALVDTGRKPDAEAARRHEQLMRAALPQAEIQTQRVQAQFASVAHAMRSAKDTHVAACAAAVLVDALYPHNAVVSLVTKNVRDFGVRNLAALGIEVLRPDAFLLNLFQRDPLAVASAFSALRATLRSGTPTRAAAGTTGSRWPGPYGRRHARSLAKGRSAPLTTRSL